MWTLSAPSGTSSGRKSWKANCGTREGGEKKGRKEIKEKWRKREKGGRKKGQVEEVYVKDIDQMRT